MFLGKRVYFMGIGGIGMSALARHFRHLNYEVSGYDKTETAITRSLTQEGIEVFYEIDIKHLQEINAVIYTPAIPVTNEEFVYCQEYNIPCYKRSEVIGWISKQYKTIAIAGTHGKTTVCSMVTTLLRESGITCSAFVGGIMLNYDSNYLSGDSPYLVVEADEYDRSFLTLSPKFAVITAADPDHLDIYHTHTEFRAAMERFANQVTDTLLTTPAVLNSFKQELKPKTLIFSKEKESTISFSNLRPAKWGIYFDYKSADVFWPDIFLPIPGEHNVSNSVAAISIARLLGLSENQIRAALSTYKGVKRRYELHYAHQDVYLIDDYAHHPEELRAVIEATRKQFPEYTINIIFQPHLFTRTRDFAAEFAAVLSLADEVILVPIYPARELSILNVSSALIYQQIQHEHKHNLTLPSLIEVLMQVTKPKSVCLITGAGDIDLMIPKMIHALSIKFGKQTSEAS